MTEKKEDIRDFCYMKLGPQNKPTGRTKHRSGNEEIEAPTQLKVVQFSGDTGFYLLYLNEQSQELTDTYHSSLEEALEQARWEFNAQPQDWTFNNEDSEIDADAIERLASSTNAVVVQLAERKYPGVVIQGDALRNMARLVQEIRSQIEKGDSQEAIGVVGEIDYLLSAYLRALDESII